MRWTYKLRGETRIFTGFHRICLISLALRGVLSLRVVLRPDVPRTLSTSQMEVIRRVVRVKNEVRLSCMLMLFELRRYTGVNNLDILDALISPGCA